MKEADLNKVMGFIGLCINSFILLHSVYLYYLYNFSGKLFYVMIPNYVLFINALFGITGISISIMLYKKTISIKLFSILNVLLWLVTLSNYFFPFI